MFSRWGNAVVRFRWAVLGAALVLVALGVTWGAGVFAALTSGGFDDPASESMLASERITDEFGDRNVDLAVLYSSDESTVDDPVFRDSGRRDRRRPPQRPDVACVITYCDTQAPELASRDRHATFVAVTLAGDDEDAKNSSYDAVRSELDAPGLSFPRCSSSPWAWAAWQPSSWP